MAVLLLDVLQQEQRIPSLELGPLSYTLDILNSSFSKSKFKSDDLLKMELPV